MKRVRRIGTGRIAVTVAAAVLASTGAAIAAGESADGPRGDGPAPPHRGQGGPIGPGGPGGPMGKYLTYSEAHTFKNGKETVIRTDAGKVKSVSDAELTITERDGNDVTIAISEDTDVLIPGNEGAEVGDLQTGQRVIATGEKGQPADLVALAPKRMKRPPRPDAGSVG